MFNITNILQYFLRLDVVKMVKVKMVIFDFGVCIR